MVNLNVNIRLLDRSKTVLEHSKHLNIPFSTLKRKLVKEGIYEEFLKIGGQVAAKEKAKTIRAEYEKNPKKCKHCNALLPFEQKGYVFCSRSCSAKNTNSSLEKRKTQGIKIKQRIKDGTWKKPSPPHFKKEKSLKPCEKCGSIMKLLPYQTKSKKYCSRQCSNSCRAGKGGGYRENSGRGKSGWYKTIYCNSSWELAWVIYQLDHNVSFRRNNQSFTYVYEGVSHKYYPDFQLSNGNYVEIKGYETPQWKAKLNQFPYPIQVLLKKEMEPILEYVYKKYGKNFTCLYNPAVE